MSLPDWFRRLPWPILICTVALMLLGVAGIERGDELTGLGTFRGKQLVWIALSLPVLLAATIPSYRRWKSVAAALYVLSVVLLVVVYAFPPKWGSRRWIPFPLMNFQPSEMAKLALILALARYLAYRENFRQLTGLILPFLMTLIPLGLILKEPDLGTSLLFIPVLFSMLFAAGAKPWHLGLVVLMGVLLSPILWLGMSAEQQSRVTAVFQQQDGGDMPGGDGYHLHQSKLVLSLGGAWGSQWTGTLLDDPLAYHLPACRTDFILCMVGERFGLLGTLAALLLYLVLYGWGLLVANRTREPFGRLVAVGIVALLAAQTVINTAMTVGLMPITGITLPLMSYGGSSLLFTATALGLLLNIGLRPGYEITANPFRFTSRSDSKILRSVA